MEIIRERKLPEEKEYQATCRYCETVFKFKQKEGNVKHDQRDGSWIEIDCPLCGHRVYISI